MLADSKEKSKLLGNKHRNKDHSLFYFLWLGKSFLSTVKIKII